MTRRSLPYRIFIAVYLIIAYILIFLFQDCPRVLFRRRKSISGQVAVITGGAMGMGKEVAKRLAIEQNAKVCILDINEDQGERTVAEIRALGGIAKFYKVDISNENALEDAAGQIENDPMFGFVSIVIANAAILKHGTVCDLTVEDYKFNNNVNYLGHIFTIKTFLGKMIERQHGHIVSIGSICSHFGEAGGSAYCSAKFAARGFIESLHGELDDLGMTDKVILTSIYPYFVNTPFITNLQEPHSTFWDIVPLDTASMEIVNAILYNRYTVFIPGSIKLLCVYMKWMTTLGTYPLGRKVFNIVCKPKAEEIALKKV
ncbi:unnamed protein product [Caenorhabditis bovis]|uniref:Uncharacterized protein n=1 Tax=Caenorhabditis bovis TaxID=2654633 RepID=A0A8S1F5E3_9PELO|nr:unnamed protein product [Caenorhabditis bovis]